MIIFIYHKIKYCPCSFQKFSRYVPEKSLYQVEIDKKDGGAENGTP